MSAPFPIAIMSVAALNEVIVPMTGSPVEVVFIITLLMLVAVAAPRAGVTKVGLVAKARTVPVPVVEYEVPHALPVELGMPDAG